MTGQCPIPGWRFSKSTVAIINHIVELTKNTYGASLCGNLRNKKINLENIYQGITLENI